MLTKPIDVPLFLLKAYARSQAADITSDDKRAFTAVTDAIKAQHATIRAAR